ncbi:MAG: FHA domain-containing protein [Planctomycetota bacterium]
MFKISLLQTNGSQKGERYVIASSPFIIGRDERCHLRFETRTISRKHCVIRFDENAVHIQDLKSRNGTSVNGSTISSDQLQEVAHHTTIEIGKYSFRISIRDAETNQPHHPPAVVESREFVPPAAAGRSGTQRQLMDELEELASQLEPSTETGMLSTLSCQEDLPDEPPEQPSRESGGGDSKAEKQAVIENHESKELEASSEADVDAPGKIPSHLRPKAPKDSQDAAATALKNLFLK